VAEENQAGSVFRVRTILHLPQYLSYMLTGVLCSEHTSIGCHTAIWDFDNMMYHHWVKDEELPFPDPVPVTTLFNCTMKGKSFYTGTGLHDSSSSLAPYFKVTAGNFILMSTGTWCISMNPFNNELLTGEQLSRDCLCYMSVNREPVKSSRFFLGQMHDTAVRNMSSYFKIHENSFMLVKPDAKLMNKLMNKFMKEKVFAELDENIIHFNENPDLFVFDNFIEAYHLLMVELSDIAVSSVNLIVPDNDQVENIFITGGFSKNLLFLSL